jgi:hypothetical protein
LFPSGCFHRVVSIGLFPSAWIHRVVSVDLFPWRCFDWQVSSGVVLVRAVSDEVVFAEMSDGQCISCPMVSFDHGARAQIIDSLV